jgi:two-component system chemotaxis sensor kinase CheA
VIVSEHVINEFIAESREHVSATERDLLFMESAGGMTDADTINRIFRSLHSIKGASGAFGFSAIMELSHAMENILLLFRNGKMAPDSDKISVLLDGVDKLSQMIDDIHASEDIPYKDELHRLNAILHPFPPHPDQSRLNDETGAYACTAPETIEKSRNAAPESIRVNVEVLDMLMNLAGELVLSRNQLRQVMEEMEHENPKLCTALQNVDLVTSDIQEHIVQMRMQPLSNILNKLHRLVRGLGRQLQKNITLVTEGGEVELDRSILEGLSDPLIHIIRNCVDHGIESAQERMLAGKRPDGKIRIKAFHEGGQVNIIIRDDGRGIDSDKVVQRAIGNGIISAEDARKMNEKEKLRLVCAPGLSLADHVTDISGRGVGMDIVKTNIEKLGGYVDLDSTPGIGTTIRIRLALTLAIIPSLIVTTAKERFAIPQVNVRELVCLKPEDVTWRIENVGEAPVLRLRERLLPLVRLADILGCERKFLHPATGEILPERRTNIADRRQNKEIEISNNRRFNPFGRRHRRQGDIYVAVLRLGESLFGLIVDGLGDIEEIVVRPLSSHIKNCQCFSGATIMGDGRVAMILDVAGIAEFAKLRFSAIKAEEQRRQNEEERQRKTALNNRWSVIVFNNAREEFFALPLGSVSRLEKIEHSIIEQLGNWEFITYRGKGLPLLRLEKLLPVRPLPEDTKEMYVIIPKSSNGSAVGIIASNIMDAVESDAPSQKASHTHRGFLGSAIVEGRLTMFLDVNELCRMYDEGVSSAMK